MAGVKRPPLASLLGLLCWLLLLSPALSGALRPRDLDAPTPRLADSTAADIDAARRVVRKAIDEASKRNKARLDHPARNNYKLKPGTKIGGDGNARLAGSSLPDHEPAPLLLDITSEIAAAAALVAEADAANGDVTFDNSTGMPDGIILPDGTQYETERTRLSKRQSAGPYWMQGIARRGTHPTAWGGSAGYQVFRNVKDFGATGSGTVVSIPILTSLTAERID